MKNLNKGLLIIAITFFALSADAQMNPKVKLQDALKLIQQNYVDPVNDESLVDASIKAMLSSLDPHSSYLSREEADAMNQSMSGSFAGIGIQFAMVNDSTFVTGVNPDGPAARAGLRLGDRILAIDGKSIFGKSLKNQEIMKMIRGEKGKAVALEIARTQQPEIVKLDVMREQIADLSVNTSYMVDSKIGYISLSIFSQSTRREMDAALKQLKAQGMTKLILDLQGNGGGYVEAAIGVADEFLEKGQQVFYAVTNTGVHDNYMTGGFGQFMHGNLVVLIDESTASSAEIVTGALQDWDRAVVLGRRSFGKGLMQKGLELADGSIIRLTGARYYTPSGRSIQKPYEKGKTDYFQDFSRRMASGELIEEGHFKFPDSLRYMTMMNKRVVYGGGGIMPDKFIPIDTSLYSAWMAKTMNSGLTLKIAFEYAQKNRNSLLATYKEFPAFNAQFNVPESALDLLLIQAQSAGIAISAANPVVRKELRTQLKAEIAGQLYVGKGYELQVRNQASESFIQAVALLNDQKTYDSLLQNQDVKQKKTSKK
ncbi:S41 family peptidase [Pedobacter duraquae]|uniref:Carboxyl-terminal processing protease n=1 Tax=Pedobacter duraquae TaxID=425511 RepID=A0A4R6IQE6_9SPHI|nr:S41 family peptidase [Pedobacter duraquae]TDO24549.1 carboxyl-terminal processing protease [Pedobacter duraquae]